MQRWSGVAGLDGRIAMRTFALFKVRSTVDLLVLLVQLDYRYTVVYTCTRVIIVLVRGRDPYRYGIAIGRSSSIHRMQIDLPEIDFNFQDPRMRRQAGLPAGSSLAFFDTPLVRTYAGVCCTHFWYWLPCARWSTTLPFHCSSREQVLPQQGP